MTRRNPDFHIAWMTVTYRGVVLAIVALIMIAVAGCWLLIPSTQPEAIRALVRYLRGPGGSAGPTAQITQQQAHFTALDGTVRVKKANHNTWVPANYNIPLEKGDVVQTGPEGIAKLSFSDGTSYSVMPDSLMVVEENSANPQARTQVSVEVITGTLDLATGVYTEGSMSQVTVAGAKASFAPQSTATVLNNPNADRHEILVKKGSGVVTRNQETLTLKDYEKASFGKKGQAMVRTQELAPPTLISPPHMASVKGDGKRSSVGFSWTPTEDSRNYRIRVSSNPYFSSTVFDKRVLDTSLKVEGLKPGTYFWVVTSENSEGRQSVESERNQFTVATAAADTNLVLELQPFLHHGRVIEIKGRAEPNTRITVNGLVVGDVRPDGSFTYFTPPLPDGESVITVTSVNPKGAVRSSQEKVMIE
jgi:hypothetical protein